MLAMAHGIVIAQIDISNRNYRSDAAPICGDSLEAAYVFIATFVQETFGTLRFTLEAVASKPAIQ